MSTLDVRSINVFFELLNKRMVQVNKFDKQLKVLFKNLSKHLKIASKEIKNVDSEVRSLTKTVESSFCSIAYNGKKSFFSLEVGALSSFCRIKNAAYNLRKDINTAFTGIKCIQLGVDGTKVSSKSDTFWDYFEKAKSVVDLFNGLTELRNNIGKVGRAIGKTRTFRKINIWRKRGLRNLGKKKKGYSTSSSAKSGKMSVSNIQSSSKKSNRPYDDYMRELEEKGRKKDKSKAKRLLKDQQKIIKREEIEQRKALKAEKAALAHKKNLPKRRKLGKGKVALGAALMATAFDARREDDSENSENEPQEQGFFAKVASFGKDLISSPAVGMLGRFVMTGFRIARMGTPLGWATLAAEAALNSDFIQDKIAGLFGGGSDDEQTDSDGAKFGHEVSRAMSVSAPQVRPHGAVGAKQSVHYITINSSPTFNIAIPTGNAESIHMEVKRAIDNGLKDYEKSATKSLIGGLA